MDKVEPDYSVSNTFSDRMVKLFFVYSIYQCILHLYFALSARDPRLMMPTSVAFLHDLTVLAIVTSIGHAAMAFSREKFKRTVNLTFVSILIITGVLLSAYPMFLREYLVFPVNILESDASGAKTLFIDYLGLSSLVPCFIAFIIGLISLCVNIRFPIPRKVKLSGLIVIFLIFSFTVPRLSPQPFIYSLQKEIVSLLKGEKRAVPSLSINTNIDYGEPIKTLKYSRKDISDYRHILLIVLEGITSTSFEGGFLTIPHGFCSRHKSTSVYYDNYYASNLDSYTSLISMLNGIQVPYRAYANADFYNKVNTTPSLTEDLHRRGFNNYFISCYQYQPFVPNRTYWDAIYERKDLPSVEQWLTLGSSKMEMATEDRAAISTIVNLMKSNKNCFILHEMVYGHSPEWRATTGKTQNEYHDQYLMELSQELETENLFDNTLFVIVSDHGDRAKSFDAENYRVPLLIVGKNISYHHRGDWLSHLELPEIIYHYSTGDEHPESRNEMFFVGSTEKWVYGMQNRKGSSLFIDNASGVILSQSGDLQAIKVMEKFQQYVNKFNEDYALDE